MADGRLKLLNMHVKIQQMGAYLAQNGDPNQDYNMEFTRIFEQVTRASADAERLYENSLGRISDYLDKKKRDFERNPARRNDPGNQKWEQRRIRSALHGYDSLMSLKENLGLRDNASCR